VSDHRPPSGAAGDLDILGALSASDRVTIAAVTVGGGGLAFALLQPPTALAALMFAGLAVTVAAADARLMLIPNILSLALFIAGLAATTLIAAFQPDPLGLSDPWLATLALGVAGAIIGAAVLTALRWLWFRARGVEAIGFGDVKLAGALGAWLGPIDLFHAFLVAALAGLALVVVGRQFGVAAIAARDPNARLPFAALLAPAAWLVFVLVRM
jgi:prepilin signal peptidase PulO-like enzyme (type II secretory pathway)